ncbi:AbrB family transcriptional regulator [Pleomorphomonas diazotrophica]|uniref:AbrB family transcriptional regulator n=1 Tax=Pleomorphomonas diazotrophica TaxID=1166257 RepID=A0A1I4W058_9HYPH|nr:AbrB/MazE/SpoVT family DNA-binding domain-containing protein [Pleomorphomonas diazotrophica]PKR88256.1 AbrB family transcriptional regulator [Pleomorphomonas diazotrophica]SFN06666.1 hypothetical protein SAMN05192571_11440 [Pleomorphomonas diazotrophica]
MSRTATLSSRFKITIPKEICAAKSWKPGQEFAYIPKDSGILIIPVPRLEDLVGVANGVDSEDYRDRQDRY